MKCVCCQKFCEMFPVCFTKLAGCCTHCMCEKGIFAPYEGKFKGEIHPKTGHIGPEGEYRYNCTLPLTLVLEGGGWSAPQLGHF